MSLESERKGIDQIDKELIELLNKRTDLAKKIGKAKQKKRESVYDPSREEDVLEKLLKQNKGNFPDSGLEIVFREIFSVSRKVQQPLQISYLGPEASFTHAAALKHFGSQCDFNSCDSIEEVFGNIEKNLGDFGVVPIENSLEGAVTSTYDTLMNSELNIIAEILMKINHNLISKYELTDLKRLYVHPLAYAQCKEWVSKNIPKVEIMEVSSTSKSVESASLYLNAAGIGSELAAIKYGLKIIAKNIQSTTNNYTRFLVIGKPATKFHKKSKTSIAFSTKHKTGALLTALEPLRKNKVNMTNIESRPTKNNNWEYIFFVDMQGYKDDKKIKKALEEMGKHTLFLKVLGSYPEKSFAGEKNG